MKRKANANWQGTGLEGTGSLTTKSGVFKEQPYSFKTRFKNDDGTLGTNPEELIAAAHAGCFTMAMSFMLDRAGFTATNLDTEAVVHMEKNDAGFKISLIDLTIKGEVPGIDKDTFQDLAEKAKVGCPISQALQTIEMKLTATLV